MVRRTMESNGMWRCLSPSASLLLIATATAVAVGHAGGSTLPRHANAAFSTRPGTDGALARSIALPSALPRVAQRDISLAADQPGVRPGYLLTLELQSGSLRLTSEADIDNYRDNRHLAADDDWLVVLGNEAGESIGGRRLTHPGHLFPHVSADQRFPMTVTIPRLDGLAIVTVVDEQQQEWIRIPIDDQFRARAAASRARFLTFDQEQRQLLRDQAMRSARGSSAPPVVTSGPPPFEQLATSLQESVALEMEQLRRLGPEIAASQRDSAVPPEALYQQMRLDQLQADEPGGTITGTVTNATTSAPVPGVYVAFYTRSGSFAVAEFVTTDVQGRYTSPPLATGSYFVRADPPRSSGLVGQLYHNLPCSGGLCSVTTGTAVWVTAPDATPNINFALQPGATITGTVTNATTSVPVANGYVWFYTDYGPGRTSASTDAQGRYTSPPLATGSYFVVADPPTSSGLMGQLYDNLPCPGGNCTVTSGTAVSVTAPNARPNINFALQPGSTITGTVTNATTSAPVSSASVAFFASSGIAVGSTNTDAQGRYTSPGLPPGSYYVVADPHPLTASGLIGQLYDNLPCPGMNCVGTVTSGTAVQVTAANTTPNINFALQPGAVIIGTVTNATTSAPVAGVTVKFYTSVYTNFGWGNPKATTDTQGRYTSPPLATGSYFVVADPPTSSGLVGQLYDNLPCPGGGCPVTSGTAVSVTPPQTTPNINFALHAGGTITGTVTNATTSAPVAGVTVEFYSRSGASPWWSATTDAQGGYISPTLPSGSYFVRANPPTASGLIPQLYDSLPCLGGSCSVRSGTGVSVTTSSATPNINFALEAGYIVSGRISGDAGAGLSGASVLIRLVTGTAAGAPWWGVWTNAAGDYSVAIPRNFVPNDFIISASMTDYLPTTTTLSLTGDVTRSLQLVRGLSVSGTARDDTGALLQNVRVRAYRSGTFIISALTNTSGAYSLTVSAGTYDLEALPVGSNTSRPLGPATVSGIVVAAPVTQNFTLTPLGGSLAIRVWFPTGFQSNLAARFEVLASGRVTKAFRASLVRTSEGYDSAVGKYYGVFTLYLPSGQYDVVGYFLGNQPIRFSDVDVSAGTTLSVELPDPYLWTGTLRGADGSPMASRPIYSYDDISYSAGSYSTNVLGQFSIPMTPNGFVKFNTDPGSHNILHTERFGSVTTGRNADCVLDAFPAFADSGAALTQMFGTADRQHRWNIVMIGDGYTGVNESYTDTNGNGQWDGVLWYDLNANGVWDSSEPYQRYGSASAPTAGTNPALTNEPFTDLNGDGVPNLHDQALFDLNTLDTARSLFGEDVWNEHRDGFNIFRIRLVSQQAGHELRTNDGAVILHRDTALGTYLDSAERGWIFESNDALVSQYINQYLPECDTRIVVVNQPVTMGRVTSYVFHYGGEIDLSRHYVIAHELGHAIGGLADEYTEFDQTYSGAEVNSPNVTALTDPGRLPWKALLTAGKEIPSVPGSGGVGLFEGAQYVTGGMYRPTEHCMMVGGGRYCPVCTNALEIRLDDNGEQIPAAVPIAPIAATPTRYPTFTWQPLTGVSHYLFELERIAGAGLVASFDVYQTSVTLSFALTDADYRWRIRPGTPNRWGDWSSWVSFATTDPGIVAFVTNVAALSVPEGGTATFQVRLSSQPASTVTATVERVSGDADLSVSGGASLTFTTANWNTYQTVTLAAAVDVDAVNGTATIRVSATGIANKDVATTEADDSGMMRVAPATLRFAGTNTNGALSPITGPQTATVTFSGGAAVAWTATANQPWVQVTNGSGTGSGTFTVSMINPGNVLGSATSASAIVTVTAAGASNSPRTVAVALTLRAASAHQPPFGSFDTPANGTIGMQGSFAVTGWALDDIGVDHVELWRDLVAGEDPTHAYTTDPAHPGYTKVYIATPLFVTGSRTDVEGLYPTYPFANRAGWGYLLLSWGLPNQGNGTYNLYAFAYDVDGHHTLLGTKTIAVANAQATKPFGALDTPGYGATVTGPFWNYGWALTPTASPACTILNGSVTMHIDSGPGVAVNYGDLRTDIAASFAGFSNGTNSGGASYLDTTTLSNGMHTIGWLVYDNCGRGDGIGSRFFTVLNASADEARELRAGLEPGDPGRAARAANDPSVAVRHLGGDWQRVGPTADGLRVVEVAQDGRIEVQLPPLAGATYAGAQEVGGRRRALPVGSSLDATAGLFYWQPAPGFLGKYDLVFGPSSGAGAAGGDAVRVRVVVGPAMRAVIDTPQPDTVVAPPFTLAGWALDLAANEGTGIDTVHVWAYPTTGTDPIFLGVAAYGDARPDVGAMYGEAFAGAAYGLTVDLLPPGTYDVVVYPHRAKTNTFEGAQVVRVVVK
jgi:hypothetical protein